MRGRRKYLVSFFKRDWELDDYPITEFQQQGTAGNVPVRFELANYVTRIDGWLRMIGTGNSREEAHKNLRAKFDQYKAEGNKLPRPGTKVPLQFASSNQIAQYDAIATDFFRRILDMDYHNLFISDSSSLWDFPLDASETELQSKVQRLYGVDISSIEDGNLVRIFEAIMGVRAA